MPKVKTHKATAKRFKVTKNMKFLKKTGSQDHFNARERGRITRGKRLLKIVSKSSVGNIRRGLHI